MYNIKNFKRELASFIGKRTPSKKINSNSDISNTNTPATNYSENKDVRSEYIEFTNV